MMVDGSYLSAREGRGDAEELTQCTMSVRESIRSCRFLVGLVGFGDAEFRLSPGQ